jgi:hypothetical protein
MFKLVMEYMGDSPKGERGGGKVRRCISFYGRCSKNCYKTTRIKKVK